MIIISSFSKIIALWPVILEVKLDSIDRIKRVEIIPDPRYLNIFWISIFDFNYYVQIKLFQNF